MRSEKLADYPDLSVEIGTFSVDISKYEIKERIDSGGYAEVYLAIDKRSGEYVALKRLTSAINKKAIKSFIREITTMARAEHPFFLHLLGFSLQKPFTLVSEYMKNGSLFKYRQSARGRAKLDGTRRTLIAMGISHAMSYLHSLNIIHRDLKSLNILLDDDLLPRLCDFGIARFMDSPQPLTHAIGTPHWMAPEMLSNDYDYGPKVDVYSFAMILYELLTDEVPWKNVRPEIMMKQVLYEKSRPKLPKNTPEQMKIMIQMCWAHDPENRPDFSEIYQMFESGEVEFDDTDEREVRKLAKFLGKIKIIHSPKKKNHHKSMAPAPSIEAPSFVKQRSYGGKQYDSSPKKSIKPKEKGPFIDLEAIADTRSYSFKIELKRASESLQKVQSRQFMNVIAEHLRSNLRSSEMIPILNALQLILQVQFHRDMFIDFEMHKMLPLGNAELLNPCLDILLVLFEKSPALFENDFVDQMKLIISKEPQKAIILLTLFAKAFAAISNAWPLLDLMIQQAKTFIKAVTGPELVSTLYFLCHNFAEFRKARLQFALSTFITGLGSKDTNTIKLCYNGLCEFFNKKIEFDFGLITEHLNDETLAPYALDLLVRITDVPFLPELVTALVNCAKTRVEATLCLLRIAAIEDGALLLLRRPNWVSAEMPTIADTLRLYLALMTHVNLRPMVQRLKQTPAFFNRLAEENDSRFLVYISSIIRQFEIDKKFIQSLQATNFMKTFFEAVLEFKDKVSYHAALYVLLCFGKVTFSPEYLMVAESLRDMIVPDGQFVGMAISIATLLSQYPLCAKKFKDLRMDKAFKKFAHDPDYKEYAQKFFENMAVTNYY